MNYADELQRPDNLYILRRTVPPWRWRETLDELLDCCRRYRIDEVCIKIDTGTFTHAFPSFEWLADYQRILLAIRDELAAIGVRYSLNPNVLQGHGDRARFIDQAHPDWCMITAPDGTRSHDCACMQSPGWQEYIRRQWSIYAQTHPATIWIEDDFRTNNHGLVGVGCFCDEHMRIFNRKYGTNYTREALHEAIARPGTPAAERAMWLDFQSERQSQMVEFLRRIVHAVSPETIVGLMHSSVLGHTSEGRDWQTFARNLTDGGRTPLLLRTPLGSYSEAVMRHLAGTVIHNLASRAALGKEYLDEGEIENFPYSGWSKSCEYTRLHIITAMTSGSNAVTLNLFDHCGMPMREENEEMLAMLRDVKPFLAGLKEATTPQGSVQGIRLYCNQKTGYTKTLPAGRTANDLISDAFGWWTLMQAGLSVTFEPSQVTALAGEDIRAATPEEIRELLSGGVLCDAHAFLALEEMGYAHWLGGATKRRLHICQEEPTAGEHYYNPAFGGERHHFFALAPNMNKPLYLELEHAPEAQELTEIVDPDLRRLCGGAYCFENELGGRIAVYPFDVAAMGCGGDAGFINFGRQRLFQAIAAWLFRDRVPLAVSGRKPMLPIRIERNGELLLGVMNYSLDPMRDFTLEAAVEHPVSRVERLSRDGAWLPCHDWRTANGRLTVNMAELDFRNPAFFRCRF